MNDIGRTVWVDVAKGIGILLVVIGHLKRGLAGSGILGIDHPLVAIEQFIYQFHMPLFFFLSGLFLLHKNHQFDFPRSAVKKFDTLLHPYLIWSLVYAVLGVTLTRYTNSSIDVSALYNFLWRPAGHMWFLLALFILSLLMLGPLQAVFRSWSWVVLILAGLLYFIHHIFPAEFALNRVVENAVFLCLACWLTANTGLKNFVSVFVLAVAGFLLFSYFGEAPDPGRIRFLGTRLMIALGMISIVCSISILIAGTLMGEWLAALGRVSLEIYLLHILALVGTRVVLQQFLGVENVSIHIWAGMLVGVAAPVVVAKFAYQLKISWLFQGKLATGLIARKAA